MIEDEQLDENECDIICMMHLQEYFRPANEFSAMIIILACISYAYKLLHNLCGNLWVGMIMLIIGILHSSLSTYVVKHAGINEDYNHSVSNTTYNWHAILHQIL